MAWTLNRQFEQKGLFFITYGLATTDGVAAVATLIDFSVDITATIGKQTYTTFKILRALICPTSALGSTGRYSLDWDATTDRIWMLVPSGNPVEVDFTKMDINWGLPNPKDTGFTGDVNITSLTPTSGDKFSFYIEGRLTP